MISMNTGDDGAGDRCGRYLERASTSPTIVFLLENLIANKCPYGGSLKAFVNCSDCPAPTETSRGMSGGFAVNVPKDSISSAIRDKTPEKFGGNKPTESSKSLLSNNVTPTIVVCQNHVQDYSDFENVVTHELIHAIDQCRVKNVDFSNISQHACSEIRASNLSGECKYFTEVSRGMFQSRGGQEKCVRRRAALSVSANPNLKTDPNKEVDKVFDRCFRDTYPFMRHPNS